MYPEVWQGITESFSETIAGKKKGKREQFIKSRFHRGRKGPEEKQRSYSEEVTNVCYSSPQRTALSYLLVHLLKQKDILLTFQGKGKCLYIGFCNPEESGCGGYLEKKRSYWKPLFWLIQALGYNVCWWAFHKACSLQSSFSASFLLWERPDFQELFDSAQLVKTHILNRPHRQPHKAGRRKRREASPVWCQSPICSMEDMGSMDNCILLWPSVTSFYLWGLAPPFSCCWELA